MKISSKDVLWNYVATFLKIASSVLLFPMILRMMPAETVGIWSVFVTITAFSTLLDFGFSPSFTRNVTYIFSGVRSLKKTGYETIESSNSTVDYPLLKSIIASMQWIYLRMALILLFLLATVGTFYVYTLLDDYSGSKSEVFIAWIIHCLINTYNLYTLYYDSLLQGAGLIKRSKQIIIIGQVLYLVAASLLILSGFGLIAIVSAQAVSVIAIRLLSYRSFFTKSLKEQLSSSGNGDFKEVLKVIFPNSFKVGITSIGSFLVQKSSMIIGSLYLTLEEVASYGITIQLIGVLSGLSAIYIGTYQPKIVQLRVTNDNEAIKYLYVKGQILIFLTFILGGFALMLAGDWAFRLIQSQTDLLATPWLLFALLLSYEETVLMVSGSILMSKNEVPFFKSAILSGLAIVAGLLVGFQLFQPHVLLLLAVPLLVDFSYQTWKWPLKVHKELGIRLKDIYIGFRELKLSLPC